MVEKKSFLRRVFSFGAATEEQRATEPETPTLPEEASIVPILAEEAVAVTPGGDDRDVSAEPDAAIDSALSEPEAESAQSGADEPAWLDPNAPEPVADFSWLDAEAPAEIVVEPVNHPVDEPEVVEPAVADVTHERDGTLDADDLPFTASAPDVALPMAATPAASSSEADFSFLEPDAPLPEAEEEDADFSWLEAPAPADSEDGQGDDAVAAGAVAGSALPRANDAGWRLREAGVAAPVVPGPQTTWFERLREGLSRSSSQLSGSITALFTKRKLDEATLQDFEDVLIQADLGVETALRITDRLADGRFGKEISGNEVRQILADEVEATLRPVALPLELDLEKKPHVILVVGVNGTGKTTTIGKLAAKLTRGGLKVTLCAGDTFRAAAVEQLKIWGERTGSEVVAKAIGADAAGLAFEAYDAAVANGSDVLIIDTAGRLQNKTELMAELEKIVRVLQRREPDAPHTVLQTLDATTGQNALSQVEIFRNVAGVNGLVMTKLDGTARGGILVAIAAKYRLPVYFIGVGEGIDDLEPFKARDFAMAIAGKT